MKEVVPPCLKGTSRFETLPEIKTILITGAAGFVGGWYARHVVQTYSKEYNVIAFDKLSYCSSMNNLLPIQEFSTFNFVRGDISNKVDVELCFSNYQIDAIVHFAAGSCVDVSFQDPGAFITDNVVGTQILLEYAQKYGVKRFVHVSTDEVYGQAQLSGLPSREDTAILRPTNPYSASKAAAEMFVYAYWKSAKVPIIIVRSNNIYGPQQYPEKVIPKFCLLVNRGMKVTVMGDGLQSRCYLYAADAVDAFDTIFHQGEIGETYNIEAQDELTTIELTKRIVSALGHDGKDIETNERWIRNVLDRPFHDSSYKTDGSKLRNLGWQQKVDFENGLKITAQWYRDFGETWWEVLKL